jgi:hypothetical protein
MKQTRTMQYSRLNNEQRMLEETMSPDMIAQFHHKAIPKFFIRSSTMHPMLKWYPYLYYTHRSHPHCPVPRSSCFGGGLVALPLLELSFPSAASLSKKSCHSSASDSLLLELLAINMGSLTLLSEGVDGVRRKGDMGMRRPEADAPPGRARPACSRCS